MEYEKDYAKVYNFVRSSAEEKTRMNCDHTDNTIYSEIMHIKKYCVGPTRIIISRLHLLSREERIEFFTDLLNNVELIGMSSHKEISDHTKQQVSLFFRVEQKLMETEEELGTEFTKYVTNQNVEKMYRSQENQRLDEEEIRIIKNHLNNIIMYYKFLDVPI